MSNNNFTAYPNALLEKIIYSNASRAEKDVFHFLVRRTYGYNLTETKLSYTSISKGTGYDRRNVIIAIDHLLKKNMIIKRACGKGRANYFGINECWEQWEEYRTSDAHVTSLEKTTSDAHVTRLVMPTSPELVMHTSPHNKEIKKIYKEKGQSPKNAPAYVKNNPFLQYDQHVYDYDVIEKELRGK